MRPAGASRSSGSIACVTATAPRKFVRNTRSTASRLAVEGTPSADMVKEVVDTFVDAKMERTDISMALYQIATEVDGPALVKRSGQRCRKALEVLLGTALDAGSHQEKFAVQMMVAAMVGATRSVLEAGASPAMVRKVRDHLVLLCQSYMMAVATPRWPSQSNR